MTAVIDKTTRAAVPSILQSLDSLGGDFGTLARSSAGSQVKLIGHLLKPNAEVNTDQANLVALTLIERYAEATDGKTKPLSAMERVALATFINICQ